MHPLSALALFSSPPWQWVEGPAVLALFDCYIRLFRRSSTVRRCRVSVIAAAATLAAATSAFAAQPEAAQARSMQARARAHIAAFPGFALRRLDHSQAATDAIVDDDGTQHLRFEGQVHALRVIGGDFVALHDLVDQRHRRAHHHAEYGARPVRQRRAERLGRSVDHGGGQLMRS